MGDYSDSGFDGFLSRSVDSLSQTNLDSAGPMSTQMPFDRAQVTGRVGDTLTIGNVRITKTGILMSDDNGNDVLLIGDE